MTTLVRDTLILQVRKELIETGTTLGQWDDTEITQFLQDGNEAAQFHAQSEGTATGVTVASQEFVNYPATIKLIKGVWVRATAGQGWTRLRPAQSSTDDRFPVDGTNNLGQPNSYFIYGDKVFLTPLPDHVYDLSFLGQLAASDMVAGNVAPNFDNRFHYLPRLYAIARCKQKVDDPGYANYDGQYTAGIVGMKTILEAERNGEGERHVRVSVSMNE